MKKYLFATIATMLALAGCTDSLFQDETINNMPKKLSSNEINILIEKARWGDDKAFLQLADCYRDGKGVEQSFVGMLTMIQQAERYGGIVNAEDYLRKLPEGSDFRLIFDAVEKCEDEKMDEAISISEQLIARGSPDGYAVQGIMAVERGDTLEGIHLMEQAADAGSTLGEFLLCFPEFRNATNIDIEKLTALSDKIPYVNIFLAKVYTGFWGENLKNESLAAHYFLKADENACLNRLDVVWLLNYHRDCDNLQLSEKDIQRLQILAGKILTINQKRTTYRDDALEDSIGQILQEAMTQCNCTKGMVYVVETATGAIKAQVSLANTGKQFVPYEDSYNDEQSVMMAGPTYLALLSSGKISSDDIIDTGCGIYKEVRDPNWYRGGYGQLTLEQALGYSSRVALTKAKELVFGNNTAQFDSKVSEYLAEMPNDAMGMLTFYNAVANGGRMVKLMTEGGAVIVLNEQIAEQEHIATLQKGLQQAVSHGLFRKAGRSDTTVSACGRTFPTKGNNRRMELCGYFPVDNPLYTIMVILEKDSNSANAGGVCAPIMARTIGLLIDSFV